MTTCTFFELKVTNNSNDIDAKLNVAKAQIINNKYERSLTDKTVIPVALVVKNNYKIREKSGDLIWEVVSLEKVDNWV